MKKKKTICIIGSEKNDEVTLIKQKMTDKGTAPVIFDFSEFPDKYRIEIRNGNYIINGVDISEIDGAYINSFVIKPFTFKKYLDDWDRGEHEFMKYQVIERENTSFKYSLIYFLISRGALVINHPQTYPYHAMKAYEYFLLKESELRFPDSISSNDPEKLKLFIKTHSGEVLYKANVGGYLHTTLINAKIIDEIKESLGVRPIMLQEYIPGYNIRCYILGDQFLCAGKILQKEEYVDSRMGFKSIELIDLPKNIQKAVLKITKTQGLIFSGVDLMYNEEKKEYYILECNSSPMFYNFEKHTKVPISLKLAECFK